jgi:hypothetical protein
MAILPTTGQADQLSLTLSDLSSWNTGLKDQWKSLPWWISR